MHAGAAGKIRGAVSLPFNLALEARTVAQQLKDREAWYILYADAGSPDKCEAGLWPSFCALLKSCVILALARREAGQQSDTKRFLQPPANKKSQWVAQGQRTQWESLCQRALPVLDRSAGKS